MKEIYFKEELKGIYSGIQKLHDAVASTMGPNGKTVIITDEYGKPYITKDGVSVARSISFKDPLENIGAQMVKEVAELQVDQAGDGTTTAIVLANAFIQNLKEFDSNEINKAFDEIIPKVLKQLKDNSRELKREDIKYVATISANNDIQIGDTIQQAYNFSDLIKVEQSDLQKDTLLLVDGMELNVSFFSKHFITNQKKGECVLEEPTVFLIDGKIEDLSYFAGTLNTCAQTGKSVLIICEDIVQKELRKLESHVLSGNLKLCIIKTPGFGQVRKDYLRDLSDFTGAQVINNFNKPLTLNHFGKLESCKINKNNSLLIKHESINVEEIIENLKELSTSPDLSKYDKEIVLKRIENLTAKVSVIKVGGQSELEMKERYDRYDDAVKAVKCALEEGIVEGGGIALMTQAMTILDIIPYSDIKCSIRDSLSAPYKTIQLNGTNFDPCKTFDQNIIDPLKVTRTALENAVSIAKTILSTNTVVLNERTWS